MGCIQSKILQKSKPSAASQRQRRHSWHMRCLNKTMRMSSPSGMAPAPSTPPASASRRSSLANMSKAHAVCPTESGANFDFSCRRDFQADNQDDFLSQMDCHREQKRNEFEDYGTSQHLTLGAFDRLEFDMTLMENKNDAFF